jgi:TonB family protein
MNGRYLAWQSIMIAGFLTVLCLSSTGQSELLQENSTAPAQPPTAKAGKPDASNAGKGVSTPILIHLVEAEIPKAARKANLYGTVIVNCWIEPDGTTSHVKVVRITLDKDKGAANELVANELGVNAVDAVKHYKFKPAKQDGKPVTVELNVNVIFPH